MRGNILEPTLFANTDLPPEDGNFDDPWDDTPSLVEVDMFCSSFGWSLARESMFR